MSTTAGELRTVLVDYGDGRQGIELLPPLELPPGEYAPAPRFDGPQDVPGRCNARLLIGDDYGDNEATMLCQLDPGHDGPHREEYTRWGGAVVVTWQKDERELEADA